MNATPANPPTPTPTPGSPSNLRAVPSPTNRELHHDTARPQPSLFELLTDLVRAQRNACDSDKWYGDWDDTHLQHVALDNEEVRIDGLSHDALRTVFHDFRLQTQMHLDGCPTLAGQADDRRRRLPVLRGLGREQVTQLREQARSLRNDKTVDLTYTARQALADLYEAHALLGEVLWDEEGCVTWAVDDLPGW